MKKVLKTIILTVLAVICTVGMVACDSSSRQNSGNSGITGAVVNGVYEVRRYYAEDGVDSILFSVWFSVTCSKSLSPLLRFCIVYHTTTNYKMLSQFSKNCW